jgi:type I restriction enzyme S subunit
MSWLQVTIGDVCLPTGQRDPSRNSVGTFRYVDIAGIDRESKRIARAEAIPCSDAPSRARKEIKVGDVIVSTVRPNLNAIAQIPEDLDGEIASTGFAVLRANPKLVDSRYLFYRAQHQEFVGYLVANATGASYPAVSDGIVRRAVLPLPPPKEQSRIIEILDEADRLRKLRRDADAKAARILPALFLKMFGDPATNSMGWSTARFDQLAEARLGKMLDAKRQTGQHRRPYLRNQNVQWDRFDLADVLEMDIAPDERSQLELRNGDLLVCEGGEIGRAAIWGGEIEECYFQKALHRVRPFRGKSNSPFLLFWLKRMAERELLVPLGTKATIPHLTGVQLAKLEVICPPFPLMEVFAGHYVDLSRTLAVVLVASDRVESVFQTLLRRAFSGQLTAKWREAHLKELLAEMNVQARLLNLPMLNSLEVAQ